MKAKETTTIRHDTLAAFDWADHLQQTEQWFDQGKELWTAWQSFTQSCVRPKVWIDATMGIATTWENTLKDWVSFITPRRGYDLETKLAELEKQRNLAQAELKQQKEELAKLRNLLAKKESSLNQEQVTVVQQRKVLAESEKQIKNLEKKIETQAARLVLLEEIGKKKDAAQNAADPISPSSESYKS